MGSFAGIFLFGVPLLVAVICHEVMHGIVAERLGDPTARSQGRITLNPIVHIDPMMTIIVPAILILSGSPIVFGGAKPVPVNPVYFKNPRRGMAIVAMAGPLTNITLATCSYILFRIFLGVSAWLPLPAIASQMILAWLAISIPVNLVLAIFNLFPVPPLDGGRIAVGFLPLEWARKVARLERYGLVIVILCLYLGIFNKILSPVINVADYLLRHAVTSSIPIGAPQNEAPSNNQLED